MSLLLLAIFALIGTALYSCRQAAGRVVAASGTEQALYSLFGQYDRELYEKYGLLFLDGGYGGTSLQSGRMLSEIEEYAEYIFNPGKGRLLSGSKNPIGLKLQKQQDAITGYVLATDDGGRAFRRQICEIMKEKLGPAGLLLLEKRLTEDQQIAEQQESEYEATASWSENYTLPEVVLPDEADEESEFSIEIPENFTNPLEPIRRMRAAGVLAMVFPLAGNISAAGTEGKTPVSERSLQKGMNMAADGWEGNGEKLMLLEYLVRNFPCYTSEKETGTLKYQIEYAIAGYKTDRENLQETLSRLLTIREGANFIHILRDPVKRSEAELTGTIISFLILNPELGEAITIAIEAAWAYGESILDLRQLVQGGKVPLIKDAASWQLPLYQLPFLNWRVTYMNPLSSGMDYEDYLRLLLFLKSTEDLTNSLMDLVEWNMQAGGRTNFRMDNCVDALSVELKTKIGQNTYSVERSYGYNA
ncbi:MAG: hypothetical protein HUJ73_05455 [Eubacterium sp.]|nr:hypothetical protein [Eubacterium sp.]